MIPFLDRKDDHRRINALFDRDDGAFACLYGRRRCGKTRLLRECTKGRTNVLYYVADRSERPAQIARFVMEASALHPAFAGASGTDWSSALDLWLALAPKGSILVFDEFPYLVEQDDALPSVLQRIVDGLRDTGKKIVICGSSQRMMQGFVLKASEPLYGRAREILRIGPLSFGWMKDAFPRMTPFERLKAWGVWGGVPRYWELQSESPDLWAAVGREVFSPHGLLRSEPHFLLLDDVGDIAQASAVLSFIGAGAHRASEIAGRMSRPITDMSRQFRRLTELGLVAKDVPFGADANGKRSYYRVKDTFLDFWYTFVQPDWSNSDGLASNEDRARFDARYLPYLGGVWERLVREEVQRKPLPGFKRSFRNAARWWGTGTDRKAMEIDVVAESSDGRTLLVGEAKLSLPDADVRRAAAALEEKARALPFLSRYENVVTRLFVADNPPSGTISLDWCEE